MTPHNNLLNMLVRLRVRIHLVLRGVHRVCEAARSKHELVQRAIAFSDACAEYYWTTHLSEGGS